LRATSPAATITCGFEVFVQLVMAAMAMWPWSRTTSSSLSRPELASSRTVTCWCGRSVPESAAWAAGSGPGAVWRAPLRVADGGSLAGNDSASAAS
jgi:hypothetical protein